MLDKIEKEARVYFATTPTVYYQSETVKKIILADQKEVIEKLEKKMNILHYKRTLSKYGMVMAIKVLKEHWGLK